MILREIRERQQLIDALIDTLSECNSAWLSKRVLRRVLRKQKLFPKGKTWQGFLSDCQQRAGGSELRASLGTEEVHFWLA